LRTVYRFLPIVLLVSVCLSLTVPPLSRAQSALPPFTYEPSTVPPWAQTDYVIVGGKAPDEPIVVRLYVRDRAHLDAVAGQLDIWEVHYDLGYAVAQLVPGQAEWLLSLGYRLEIDVERTMLLGIQAPLDPRFYYFDDDYSNSYGRYMVNFLQDINTAYPDITELFDIGDAWQAEHGGYHRDMWVLRISNEDPVYGDIADKPVFYLFANIHAREVATPEMAIRYIRYLTEGYDGAGGYGVDPDVTWLVDHNVAYVLVSQNPDGHRVNEANTSAMRRKNMDNDDGCTDPGSWGVDLNRNHSFFWGCCGGSSGQPCSETYRGPSRGSEPETAYFQAHFASVMRDQNGPNGQDEIAPASPLTTTGVFLSLHTYSDLVLWPFGFSSSPAPNDTQLRAIGRKLATYNGYDPSGDIYTVDGSSDDWTYGMFGVASFTFEIGPSSGSCGGFFPAYGCMDGIDGMTRDFWAENRPAFLYLHKIARTPYMTVYGPDTHSVAVSEPSVPQGTPVQLTATVFDARYGGDPLQPVVAAEYFADFPGADGTGTPMSPADGAWGGTSEGVVATVDTSALAPGRHYLLVHGRNDDGDWGPFTAVFLTTTIGSDPEVIALEAAPASIPVVYGQAALTATLTLLDGTPVPGWVVTFTTDLGTVDPPTAVSDMQGHAVTTLTAGGESGTAHVQAEVLALSDDATVEIYVPDAPVASFVSDSPACVNAAMHFTNTTTYPPEVPVAFQWAFGDGGSSGDPSPAHVYTLAGDYAVSLNASNVGGDDTFTDTVTVLPVPVAGFTFSPVNPDPGQAVHFTDTSANDPIGWQWAFGDGGAATVRNPNHTYYSAGTYTVTLRARNACGWSTTVAQPIRVGGVEQPFPVYLPVIMSGG